MENPTPTSLQETPEQRAAKKPRLQNRFMELTLFPIFRFIFKANVTWNEASKTIISRAHNNQAITMGFRRSVYVTNTDKELEIEIYADLRSRYPKLAVRTNILKAHDIITDLIKNAETKFDVSASIEIEAFEAFMAKCRDGYEGPQGNQVNKKTMIDIKDWVLGVGARYSKCFITMEDFEKENALTHATSGEQYSIKRALGKDKCNVVIYSEVGKAVLNRSDIDALGDDERRADARRTPCKERGEGIGPNNMMKSRKYIDLLKAGCHLNNFVPESDFNKMAEKKSSERIFTMIPSFDEYEGLVSDGAFGGHFVGGMHCSGGDRVMYTMTFLFPCAISTDVQHAINNVEIKACISNPLAYKTENPPHGCKWPMVSGEGCDQSCCVVKGDEDYFKQIMCMYAMKRVNTSGYSFLSDIYNMYIQDHGVVQPYNTHISLVYPPEEEVDNEELQAFLSLRPSVKELSLYTPNSNEDSFADWYGKVNNQFSLKSRFEVSLYASASHLDHNILTEVIANKPLNILSLSLKTTSPINNTIQEDVIRTILTEMYKIGDFIFFMRWRVRNIWKKSLAEIIREAGFIEKEERRRIHVSFPAANFREVRSFVKEHVFVQSTFEKNSIKIRVVSGKKFEPFKIFSRV